MKNISDNKQYGAVSLFVVIFAMLLITVITVSFVRIMVADQQQASDNDLSQSAYDSAQAGVEDAKRAILKYQQECSTTPGTCESLGNYLSDDVCNKGLSGVLGTETTNEISVKQSMSGNDTALNQFYTCVKIKLQTEDYQGELTAGGSQLVPLISESYFNRVGVEWFSTEDLTDAAADSADIDLEAPVGQPLYNSDNWPVNRPPVMRTQLIQFANNFTLDSFDTASGNQSNTAAVFLYPTRSAPTTEESFLDVDRRSEVATPKGAGLTPLPVRCKEDLNSELYACRAVLVLPETVGMTNPSAEKRTAFLRLEALYNATHFKVTLWDSPVNLDSPAITPRKFKDVQPEIDSTGRANDLYRRVVSRVNLYDTSFPYPEGTIDVTGNFCKDFSVTNETYMAGTCTP